MFDVRIRAVVFDMDGVVFDTEELYFLAEDEMLSRRGKRFTPALAELVMGMPGLDAMAVLARELNLTDDPKKLFAETKLLFRGRMELDLALLPGFETFFAAVCGRPLPRALATSTERELAMDMLERFSLPARFDAVLTRDDVVHGKPDPEIFIKACRALNTPPAETLVLEDSLNGVRAALAAGCLTVAMRHNYNRHLMFPAGVPVADSLDSPSLMALVE